MIITRLNTVQDKDSSRIVLLNINLEEIIRVQSQIIQLNASQLQAGSAREQGTSSANKGRTSTKEVDNSTLPAKAFDFIFGKVEE